MITTLIREDLKSFSPYENAKITADSETIRMHANESPWSVGENQCNRYPQRVCNQKLSEYYQVDSEQILATRGSDEGIDLIVRLFCQAGRDEVLTLSPLSACIEWQHNYKASKSISLNWMLIKILLLMSMRY